MKYEITYKDIDKKITEVVEGDLGVLPTGIAIVNKLKQVVAFYGPSFLIKIKVIN